jgi:pyruvate formate lyase activating enzyme
VTNGYMSQEMLQVFHPYLDGAAVDLKTFRDETYRVYIGGRLRPVLDNLKMLKGFGIWVEVTTLVIPGINDDHIELRETAGFLATEMGVETPWHLSRFFPAYKLKDIPPTPITTLEKAREIGLVEGLHHVYLGNIAAEQNTYCHHCGEPLIRRSQHAMIQSPLLKNGACSKCDTPLAGKGLDQNLRDSGTWSAHGNIGRGLAIRKPRVPQSQK